MAERPEFDRYEIVMPFVTVTSRGGPHEDEAYVCGWEMGSLDLNLAQGHSVLDITLHAANRAQADLLAMKYGYQTEVIAEDEEWLSVSFTRADGPVVPAPASATMTADPTPRERVARAIRSIPVGPLGPNALAIVNQGGSTRLTPREAQGMADAALTALAGHPGLVEVLREHIPCAWSGVLTPDDQPMMTCGRVLPDGPDRLSAHLADVVRAWLLGRTLEARMEGA